MCFIDISEDVGVKHFIMVQGWKYIGGDIRVSVFITITLSGFESGILKCDGNGPFFFFFESGQCKLGVSALMDSFLSEVHIWMLTTYDDEGE